MALDKNLKAVIFDFDGTLFHLVVSWQTLKEDLRLIGVDNLDSIEDLADDKKKAAYEIIREAESKGIREGKSAQFALETLNSLAEKYVLAIVSRNLKSTIQDGLRKIGFIGFIEIIGREDVNRLKPDPHGFELALERMGVNVSEVIIVGDTTHDVEAAKALGIMVYIVENEHLNFRPSGADKYISSLRELIHNQNNNVGGL